jgi:ribosomal protein L30/L7E
MAKPKPQQTTYSTLANYHATQKHHGETLRDHTSTLYELRLHKARMDATLHEHKARTDAKLHSLEAHRDTLHSLERKRITDTSNVRSEVNWAKMQAIMIMTLVVVVGMTAWKMLAAEVEALRREVRARRG